MNRLQVERLAHELATQHNAYTADPMFVVQERVRDYGYDPAYCDRAVWLDAYEDNREATAEEHARLEAGEDLGDGWTRTGYRDRWRFVTAFLTRRACRDYIEANAHRHSGQLRTYVDSAHRNPEWRALRAHFLAIHDERARTETVAPEPPSFHVGDRVRVDCGRYRGLGVVGRKRLAAQEVYEPDRGVTRWHRDRGWLVEVTPWIGDWEGGYLHSNSWLYPASGLVAEDGT